jgi:hypothetical protein
MTYAKNYRDGKWYQASVVRRMPWGVAEVQFHEGPEKDVRDLVLDESVRENIVRGSIHEATLLDGNRLLDRRSA